MRNFDEHLWMLNVLKDLKTYANKQDLEFCAREIDYVHRHILMALGNPCLEMIDSVGEVTPAQLEKDRASELLRLNRHN